MPRSTSIPGESTPSFRTSVAAPSPPTKHVIQARLVFLLCDSCYTVFDGCESNVPHARHCALLHTLVKTSICPWDLARLKASAVLWAISKNSIAPFQSPASWQYRETISAPELPIEPKGKRNTPFSLNIVFCRHNAALDLFTVMFDVFSTFKILPLPQTLIVG